MLIISGHSHLTNWFCVVELSHNFKFYEFVNVKYYIFSESMLCLSSVYSFFFLVQKRAKFQRKNYKIKWTFLGMQTLKISQKEVYESHYEELQH